MAGERWQPDSEDAIRRAIAEGLLRESHYLDVKREVEPTSGARKEFARDLASFAIDGGSLLVGVHEDKSKRTWVPTPVALAGQAERFEAIASSLIDPPLYIQCREIRTEVDPTSGYLWVDIAPSSEAPHMVDGVYYGRGDKTRSRLSDSEVIRYHTSRVARVDIGVRLLREEVLRDPIPEPARQHGHLYLVAQPSVGSASMAREFVREPGASGLWRLIESGEDNLGRDIGDWAPRPGYASTMVSRPRGVARCSPSLESGRVWRAGEPFQQEKNMIDIEFREDGGIRVLVGRMTDVRGDRELPILVASDGLALAYAHRVIVWAWRLSRIVNYRGSWTLAVEANGLRGAISTRLVYDDAQSYSEAEYREATIATLAELNDRPRDVADRLVGPLLRGLGSYHLYRQYVEYGDGQ